MQVEQLRPGLWRWTTTHPEWTEEQGGAEGWEAEVSSFALVEEDALVLIDPLVPAEDENEERFWRALDDDVAHHGPPQILLTLFWHVRSSPVIRARYPGARVWAPARRAEEARKRVEVDETFGDGDRLPGGIEVKPTVHRAEELFWIPAHRALVAGDVLLGTGAGGIRVCPDSWLVPGVTGSMLRDALQPLLDLPVELVLVAHGEPVLRGGRDALAAALAR